MRLEKSESKIKVFNYTSYIKFPFHEDMAKYVYKISPNFHLFLIQSLFNEIK